MEGEVERRRCASMERLLLEAHTVQKRSLKEVSGEVGSPSVVVVAGGSAVGVDAAAGA